MKSEDLAPGTRMRWVGPSAEGLPNVVTLKCRKKATDVHHSLPYHPGWWLEDGRGGLADFVIDADDSDWEVAS